MYMSREENFEFFFHFFARVQSYTRAAHDARRAKIEVDLRDLAIQPENGEMIRGIIDDSPTIPRFTADSPTPRYGRLRPDLGESGESEPDPIAE